MDTFRRLLQFTDWFLDMFASFTQFIQQFFDGAPHLDLKNAYFRSTASCIPLRLKVLKGSAAKAAAYKLFYVYFDFVLLFVYFMFIVLV